MAIREGKWKCPSCATVNRGAHTQCAQCGTTRDANVKFFLDDDAQEVTDAAQLAAAQAGADWICEFCGNTSPQASPTCTGCGAPKSAKQRKAGDVIPVAAAAPPPVAQPVAPPQPAKGCSPAAIGVVLLMLLSCLVCMWWQFRTQGEVATVAAATWQRTIEVEDFIPVDEEAWDRAPEGAVVKRHQREKKGSHQEQHGTKTVLVDEKVQVGTKKVKTGDKDLGNGHFEEVFKDEPVYENKKVSKEVPNMVDVDDYGEKYYYTIDRWKVVRSPTTAGRAPDAPKWPDEAPNSIPLKGKERKGKKTELYLILFKGQKVPEKVMKAPSQGEWEKFKPGSTWKAEFNNAGDYKVLDASGQPTPLEKTDEKIAP